MNWVEMSKGDLTLDEGPLLRAMMCPWIARMRVQLH